MLYGWKENSMLTNCLVACIHLSSTVSQLFEPQVQKIAIFTYRRSHFCFPWRRRCDYHAMCCMDGKSQDRAYAYASRGNKTYILNFANHRVATRFNWYKRRVKNRILAQSFSMTAFILILSIFKQVFWFTMRDIIQTRHFIFGLKI